jgi:hypothetical protein
MAHQADNENYDAYNPAQIGHNQPPKTPYETIKEEIDDLFGEAKLFADGEPITTKEIAEAVTALHDSLHAKGKEADELRVKEKEPFDNSIKAIQDKYNLLIGNTKSGKGKVVLGKEVLQSLLTPWRNAEAKKKEEAARLIREEADRIAAAAQAAIRASAGNLEAREEAEALLKDAKATERDARRADKAATTGTGLRTIWIAELVDEGKSLDWAYGRAPEQFKALCQSMADAAVRSGVRAVPGFRVYDERVAN